MKAGSQTILLKACSRCRGDLIYDPWEKQPVCNAAIAYPGSRSGNSWGWSATNGRTVARRLRLRPQAVAGRNLASHHSLRETLPLWWGIIVE